MREEETPGHRNTTIYFQMHQTLINSECQKLTPSLTVNLKTMLRVCPDYSRTKEIEKSLNCVGFQKNFLVGRMD
jgi:hypothetical protein